MSKGPNLSNATDIQNFLNAYAGEYQKKFYSSVDLLILIYNIFPKQFEESLKKKKVNADSVITQLDAFFKANALEGQDKAQVKNIQAIPTEELANCMVNYNKTEHNQEYDNDIEKLLSFILIDGKTGAAELLLNNSFTEDLNLSFSTDLVPTSEVFGKAHPKSEKSKQTTENKDDESSHEADNFITNLTDLAYEDKLDPAIGREDKIKQIFATLIRRRKNNPLLLAESGEGKTTTVHGAVQAIVDGDAPKELLDRTVYLVDLPGMLAGSKYRGDFEKRLKNIIDRAIKENAILFLDETHTIVGAGESSGSKIDASNILKPYLESTTTSVSVIGATTYREYRNIIKDPALERRFQPVEMDRPSIEEVIEIVTGLCPLYEEHHEGVGVDESAIISGAELVNRYLRQKPFVDTLITLIDTAMADHKMHNIPKDCELGVVTENDMYFQLEKVIGRKISRLNSAEHADKLLGLNGYMTDRIINQGEPLEILADHICTVESGLSDMRENKTRGAFLAIGDTGVGKTETAKGLSDYLDVPLIRLDMSEYMEKHSVSRLIGSPNGFKDSDEGGELTEAVSRNPYCVLLLDEVEKAHPAVFNILLQVLDNGALKDSTGRLVDFQNVVLYMSGNLGAKLKDRLTVGFKQETISAKDQRKEALKGFFLGEFISRLDDILYYNPLTELSDFVKIVDRKVEPYIEQVKNKHNITITFTKAAREHIATVSKDQKEGARPVAKTLKKLVETPLAYKFLQRALKTGDQVKILGPLEGQVELDINIQSAEQKRIEHKPAASAPKELICT